MNLKLTGYFFGLKDASSNFLKENIRVALESRNPYFSTATRDTANKVVFTNLKACFPHNT